LSQTKGENRISTTNNDPIKNSSLNLNISAELTTKQYKIQNRSQKNSHSCVPLKWATAFNCLKSQAAIYLML
jgi:hypothetical protein